MSARGFLADKTDGKFGPMEALVRTARWLRSVALPLFVLTLVLTAYMTVLQAL